MTTIDVAESTWKRLIRHKEPGDTFDDIVVELLDTYEAAHEPPMTDGGDTDNDTKH